MIIIVIGISINISIAVSIDNILTSLLMPILMSKLIPILIGYSNNTVLIPIAILSTVIIMITIIKLHRALLLLICSRCGTIFVNIGLATHPGHRWLGAT